MKALVLLIFTALLIVNCAKERPENTPQDDNFSSGFATGKVMKKTDVLGRTKEADVYFSKVTVVGTSTDYGPYFVGLENDIQAGFFKFTEDLLQFKNIQGAYKGRESADSSAPIIFQFPVTHHQFQLAEVDGQTTNNIVDDKRQPWFNRSQFQIDFANAKSAHLDTTNPYGRAGAAFGCYNALSRSLVDKSIQTEDGYFSFVVEVVFEKGRACEAAKDFVQGTKNHTVRFRYSFRKMEQSNYKPWTYKNELDPEMRKFGYFQSVKEEINPVNNRINNVFLINRWDPNKEHNFYFTKEFPEKYKKVFYQIFDDTNAMFASKGLTVRFNMRENNYGDGKVKEFGDLRYSFVNLIDEISPSGPLGYGPSNANPFTGEILAANLNMYTANLEFYVELLERSANHAKTKFDESDLFNKMKTLLKTQMTADQWGTKWEQGSDIAKLYNHMANETIYGYPGWHAYTQTPQVHSPGIVLDSINGNQESKAVAITDPILSSLKEQSFNTDFFFTISPSTPAPLIQAKVHYGTDYSKHPVFQKLSQLSSAGYALPDMHALSHLHDLSHNYEQDKLQNISLNRRGHCMFGVEEALAGAEKLVKDGFVDGLTPDQIIETILYRVGIHELGHNLSLRHNFYGSIDRANFPEASEPKMQFVLEDPACKPSPLQPVCKKVLKPVLDENGQQELWPAVSSSVMDYLRLEDEFFTEKGWEPYDVAALTYLYSGGLQDMSKERDYLFCTDDHTINNALCNRFDLGQSPTEVVMSIIKDYENDYNTRNKRFGRAYWNTSGYGGAIFRALHEIKEFLPMWRSSFYSAHIREEAQKIGYDKHDTEQLIIEMNREVKEAIKLSVAFYQAVLQTSNSDKPYRSRYTEDTMGSALQRIGISEDKLISMYFLAGDDPMFYNPNRFMIHASYLTYMNEPELAPLMDEVLENLVTQRVDMEPWFISFGRVLFAQSSMNFYNRTDETLVNKIKIKRYTPEDLQRYFDYTPTAIATTKRLTKSLDFDFIPGEEVAVVLVNSHYYVFSVQESPYAYDIYKGIKLSEEFNNPSVTGKLDLQELYYIYTLSTGGTL